MAAEYVCCSMMYKKFVLQQAIKKDGLLRQPITCYEIAKFCYDICGKSYNKYDPCYAVPRR